MRFVGSGHPAIRATHHKTLELITADEITARATCVVGVGMEPEPLAPMAGPVRIRISVGTHRFSLNAVANSSWEPGGPAVIRRGALRLPGTFATNADAASSDLPRDLVAALAAPDALVTMDVAPIPTQRPVIVLFAADPSRQDDLRLHAEIDAATEISAQDAGAGRLVEGREPGGRGNRTLVVATRELPGSAVLGRLGGIEVDTVGLSPELAVAAACPSRAPLTIGGDLRTTPSAHRLVLSVKRADLPDLLRRAADERGVTVATVMQDHGRPLFASPDEIPDLPGAVEVACCLHPAPADDALDPLVRAAVDALLADGVPTRTAAKALAALAGWDRRRAYDAVLTWPGALRAIPPRAIPPRAP
ncbi:MAG: DUF371 domain-containing protein [Jatrophihabitans sp.]